MKKSFLKVKAIMLLVVLFSTSTVVLSSNLFRNEQITLLTQFSTFTLLTGSSNAFGTLSSTNSLNSFGTLSLNKSFNDYNEGIIYKSVEIQYSETKKTYDFLNCQIPTSQYIDPNIQANGKTDAVVSKVIVDGLTGGALGVLFYFLTDKNSRGTIGPWIGVGTVIGISWGVLF